MGENARDVIPAIGWHVKKGSRQLVQTLQADLAALVAVRRNDMLTLFELEKTALLGGHLPARFHRLAKSGVHP